MTTPERFRRRQRIEGVFLIILAIVSVAYGVWDSERAQARDECMADNFRASGYTLERRAELTEKATQISLRVDALQAHTNSNQDKLIADAMSAEDKAEAIAAFVVFQRRVEQLDQRRIRLDERQSKLLRQRQRTDLPPFPSGTCE